VFLCILSRAGIHESKTSIFPSTYQVLNKRNKSTVNESIMGSSASKDNAPVVENMEEVNQEVDTFTFEDSSDLVEETEVSSEEDGK